MKAFFQNRWFIGVVSFLLGGLTFWSGQKALEKTHFQAKFVNSKTESPFVDNEDLFDEQDPFEQMRKMQSRMMKQMQQDVFNEDSGAATGNQMGIASGLKTREDDKYVYYDIEFKGMSPSKFDVNVENGQVNISGQFEKKAEESNNASFVSSSFQRSFPAPENTDADKFQTESKGNVITLKFPKRAST